MADDYIKSVGKFIDLTVQTTKLTKEVFLELLENYLAGNTKKKGKVSLGELDKSANGKKLESIEITDNNIRDFRNVAAKYDINYALKRDSSTTPPTYHVFFQASSADDFKRAFNEYASKKQNELGADKSRDVKGKIRAKAQEIANQPREPKQKHKERKKEEVL